MIEFLSLKPKSFGLDFSDLSLRIAKLKKRGRFLGLASWGEMEIKPGLIEEGEVKDEDKLAEVIKKALNEVKGEKLKTKNVIASLPEEKAFLQVIQMPRMEKEELKTAVSFEAENYVPFPIEKVYLDFQIVPPVQDHLDHLDVLIAALPKKTVDSYLSCLKKAGLLPQALEIESQSISRALLKDGVSPFPIFIIDFGQSRTSFIIFSGYSLRFTSSIITSSRTELVEEIKKYIAYYYSHSGHEHLSPNGKEINEIILCGRKANLLGLTGFLSSELQIPVKFGNPWINILPEPLKEVPGLPYKESLDYTTALGLALRGIKK